MSSQGAARLRLVIVAGLSDPKLQSKIAPFLAMEEVTEVAVVRRTPLPDPRVRNVCPPAAVRAAPLAEAWRLLSVLRLCLERPRPAFLIAFFFVPHVAYIDLLRRALGVSTIPVALSQEDIERTQGGFFQEAVKRAHAVGVRGSNSAARLAANGVACERIFAPPNVFLPGPYRPEPAAAKDIDLVFVGALEPVKQLDLLLQAVALLRETRPQVRLAIVGEGPERSRLESLAAQLGLAQNVLFAGHCSPESIARQLNRSRLFVMTSRFEGLPMAMIEALSCGLPVVVPDVGDITTVARHEDNAWVLSEGTPGGYAEALARLLDDEALRTRLGAGALRAREPMLSAHSLESAVGTWRAAFALPKPF